MILAILALILGGLVSVIAVPHRYLDRFSKITIAVVVLFVLAALALLMTGQLMADASL